MKNISRHKKMSRPIAIIVAVIVLVGLSIFYNENVSANSSNVSPTTTSQTGEGYLLPSPKTISPFTVTDDKGKPFGNDNLKGHWTFLFFGFSRCPGVCPTTMANLNNMTKQLEKVLPSQSMPQVVMITVDPEMDTTAVMHSYVKNFNSDFIGATADTHTLNTFSKDLGMLYQKVPQANGGYMMDHSAELYLFNPNGNWIATFGYPIQVGDLVKSYESIIKSAR